MKNNAEIIKGIDLTIEGLTTIKNALMVADETEAPKSKSVARREKAQAEPMNPPEENDTLAGNYTVEQLKAMKYNDFKKLASQLGVKCTGTRDEIMERILSLNNGGATTDEETGDKEEDKTPAKSNKSTGIKKLGKKKADEPVRDEFDEQAEEASKSIDVEDILEALAEVGIKANESNAVNKLAGALREGLIKLDNGEDTNAESNGEVAEKAGSEDTDINADSYFEEYDPEGYNNFDEMPESRAEAIINKMNEILTSYSDGTLTDEDITSYVEENATDDEIELLGDNYTENDVLKMYMELIKRTIDNDGVEHEPGDPYEIADKEVCCGHELKYIKKTKKYICEKCGNEYQE